MYPQSCGNVLWGTNAGRDRDLWENRLDFVYKDIFDQGGNKARFSGAFVAAYADPYYKSQLDSSSNILLCDYQLPLSLKCREGLKLMVMIFSPLFG